MKNNTCIMALILIYENNGESVKLCCLFYHRKLFLYWLSVVSIKTLISISSKPTFEDTSCCILIRIGIPELLLNLVPCHGFMRKPDSAVILNLLSRLINDYLSKVLYIIEKGSNKLSLLPNYVRLRINLNNQLNTDFIIAKNTAISVVSNTIKQLHIHTDMHMIYN